jgi:hypothetical protein
MITMLVLLLNFSKGMLTHPANTCSTAFLFNIFFTPAHTNNARAFKFLQPALLCYFITHHINQLAIKINMPKQQL